MACLSACKQLLQQGASVLFFPEGTRATDRRLQEFKKVCAHYRSRTVQPQQVIGVNGVHFLLSGQGAFSVAAKAGVPVVPITLIGTGRKMPNKQESRLFPGDVHMIIHPPVLPHDADKMLVDTREAILSRLPLEMHPQST